MKKFLKSIIVAGLLFVGGTFQLAAQELNYDSTYRPGKYQELVAKFRGAPHSKKDIVFLGNSITAHGKWDSLLNLPEARNRGISGDITFGILERLEEVIAGKPAKVFVLIGINDISRNVPDSLILRNYKSIIQRIKIGSKRTKIYFYTLLPVNSSFAKFKKHYDKDDHILWLNEEIKKLADKEITIIDLYPHFTDEDKHLLKNVTPDGLHLNNAGYEIWKKVLLDGGYLK